ncbi:Positive transcriptional regulator, MutR family [Streptococcus sp. DD11]|uniref:Rgg/GadR/MutR family transcriptional regulator n=1 Tax=Streptococcus sp. DD11 TaxID=1777879 RepID=UPI000792C437|nr:Rgg/GadR/MutR family transcriptional regulator [Streptococcus sp. DD11]KXT85723.1 Positive transcriptional regulator, MutR family [Streptococcus sp. DD11]
MEAREKFKVIRKQRRLSLKDLESVAGSATSISDYENGKTNLSYDTLFQLLGFMQIEYNEFFSIEDFYPSTFLKEVKKLQIAVLNEDIEGLEVSKKTFERLYLVKNYYLYHIISLTIAVVISNLQNEKADSKAISELTDYYFSIDYWTNLDVGLFGNTVRYFTSPALQVFFQTIFRIVQRPPQNNIDRIKIDTLLNCASVIIERREKDLADAMLLKLNHLSYASHFSFEKLNLQELKAVYESIWGDQNMGQERHQRVLTAVALLFSAEEAEAWDRAFKKLVG